ncbi:purine transporter [Mycena rebaudengoi]|nr:purine transporter [Mycena rebaudengoi]
MVHAFDLLNAHVADSFVGRWFRLEGSGHAKERIGSRFTTEIRAGITTWAAMAYIISVNAAILSDSGGTCVCSTNDTCPPGTNVEYDVCVNEVRNDLITTTAAISALASFLMGLLANLPVGMAPGLGLNAYFAYSVVGFHGTGILTYREALSAVFLEGWIFLFLSIIGLRQWLVRIMPQSLVLAVGAGIGLFIAFIGLSSGGLGVIGGDPVNLVGLGGCLPENLIEGTPYCARGVLQSPTMWLGIFLGGILTVLLMIYRVRGAILIGIFLTSIVSWPRPTAVTYFPHTPAGDALFDYFKQVVTFHRLERVGNAIDYHYGKGRVWYALVTFLYVDILDTTGTLYSMAKFAGLRDPVTLDFENSTIAYCVDAFSISMGALMGTSPVTAFIESATGISEGGKTGITAMVTGVCFFISVFFAPIFASIPAWATGGALIIVGSLMIRNVRDINWDYIGDAVPAFLTLIIIPLSYNIAYGVIAGILSYLILNGIPWVITRLTGGRIVPPQHRALGRVGHPAWWNYPAVDTQDYRDRRARGGQRHTARGAPPRTVPRRVRPPHGEVGRDQHGRGRQALRAVICKLYPLPNKMYPTRRTASPASGAPLSCLYFLCNFLFVGTM